MGGIRLSRIGLIGALLGTSMVLSVGTPASALPPLPNTSAPEFTAPTCGAVVAVPAVLGGTTTVAVSANDASAEQTVALAAEDLPSWASFTATDGNPAEGTLSSNPDIFLWAQGVLGDLFASIGTPVPGLPSAVAIVTLEASDDGSPALTTECPVTLRIVALPGSPV